MEFQTYGCALNNMKNDYKEGNSWTINNSKGTKWLKEKVTCSSVYENGNAWDGWVSFNERSSGDGWYATSSPSWIQYEFNEPLFIRKFYIYAETGSSGANLTSLTMQCSEDGINYEDVMDEYLYTIGNKTYINIDKMKSAKFWQLNFTNAARVYNLQFYGFKL